MLCQFTSIYSANKAKPIGMFSIRFSTILVMTTLLWRFNTRSNYVVCQFIVRDMENLINFCSRFTIEYLQSSNYRGTFAD